MQNTNVQTFQTWAVVSDEITNNSIMTLSLPATLANSMLAFEFYNGDTPITTNTTSGSLVVTGKYKNGRNRSVATIDLANVNEYPVLGLYSSLTFSLTNLVGCNRVVVYAVQYANIIPTSTSSGDGATSIEVTSPNSSVAQVGPSTYDPVLKKIIIALQSSGTGGTPTQVATAVDTGGVANKNYFRVTYPGGATFTTSTASTGAMRISLPLAAKPAAFDIRMSVSIISTSGTFLSAASTLEISAYWAIGTWWLFTNATLTSALAQDLVVTFGQRSDNASPCIYLGKTTNTWDTGTRISVDNVEAGRFGAVSGVLQDGWSIDVVTTINTANELESLAAPIPINNCLTAASELAGYDSAGNLILQLNNTGGALPGVVTAQTAAKGVQTGQLATLKSMFDNGINYLYSTKRYVDNVGGLDTNNGSYNSPYKTMLYSVTNNPTGTIHVLMGQTAEPALSIPANKTNIDIIAQGTRSALNGFTNKVTVLGTGAGSVRFQGINFGGGLTRDATCTCGIYVYNGSVGSAGFTQTGNGYTELNGADVSNGTNTLSAGTIVFYGGKAIAPVITGSGTTVTFDNVGTVIGNTTMATGGTLYAFETNFIALATGYAITSAAGTVTTMQGCNFIRSNGTLASISVSNYDIQNTDFDRANSILSTHIGNYDWFARLALLNADTVTTATKMLVRKPTGEIAEQLIPGGSTQRSSLYLAGYGAASPVQNGNLDFSDSSSVSSVGTGITYAGVNISLEAGKNYNVTTMLNSIQAGVPDASRKIISYSGATTSGNNFAFDNTNMTATNGSITNNVYVTSVALPIGTNGAVAPTVAYDTSGSINLLIPSATISPYQCVLYSGSTANNWSIYGQAAYSANALLTLNAGALTVAAVNRVDTQGGTFGSGELEFTHPYTGVNPTEYAACAGYGISVVSDSLSSTRFAYKKGGNAFVLQATAFTNSVVMNGSLTACYSPTLDVAVFVGTSAVSAQINLTTGAFVQTTFGTQGCVQVNRGLLTGVETFVGVGSTTNPLTIRKSTDGSTWTALAANNLTAILPTTGTTGTPVYSISGICQTLDGENAWLVAVNDTVNNICHICTSSGLLIFQKIKSYYGFNVTGLLSLQFGGTTGTSNVGGSSAIVGASSNTTGAGNIVIYNKGYYGTESSWLTVTNPTITSTQAIRLGVSPSGMIYVWNAQNGTAVAYSNNGGSSYTTTTLGTAFTYLMPYADFKIISGSTTSASRQYNASYRWNYSGGTYIPKAVWLNSQKLQAGVNSSTSIVFTDIIPNSYVVNLDGTITMTGAPLSIVGNNNRYFKVGVSSLNSYEKVSYLSGSVFAVSNTFLYKITGTNCTVATTTQAPGLQGNVQTSVQAQVTNVTANATIQLNSSYNSGTNTLGGGNSILVTEI